MRNVDGHQPNLNGQTAQSKKSVGKTNFNLSAKEVDFLDSIKFYGINECIRSLKATHNLALYHTTELCLSTKDISALFCLKLLWEGLEETKEK